MQDLQALYDFLPCETPDAWVQHAIQHLDIILIDHAHCEKKAASTAMSLLYRYVAYPELLQKMSRIVREECRHFEKVLAIMTKRNITYQHLSASRYAAGMREHIRAKDPERLVDTMIVGAFIEARSCERFAKLAPHLDPELEKFYRSLLQSEARHFQDYLNFAHEFSNIPIDERVALFRNTEEQLITTPDPLFRFHSGVPLK